MQIYTQEQFILFYKKTKKNPKFGFLFVWILRTYSVLRMTFCYEEPWGSLLMCNV